jgi:AcrR family transcriptional regulator
MGLVYHDGMSVPRQEESFDTGRVNQKRRTRAAIVAAAKRLLDEGSTPTVAQAAEAALTSRTTAYRYFPTQEALLVEVAMNVDVDAIEQLVARPVDEGEAVARALAVLDEFNGHVFAAETQYRTALRLYLDLWLEAAATGDDAPIVREGRRVRWFETSLAPLRSSVTTAEWQRLITVLCLLSGPETLTVLRDVCQIDRDTARAITSWAAETVIRATFT